MTNTVTQAQRTMTSSDFRNIARCYRARLLADRSVRTVADSEFNVVLMLLQRANTLADREIAANGSTTL